MTTCRNVSERNGNDRSLIKSDFSYELPPHLIANAPTARRTDSRLMVIGSDSNDHRRFEDLLEYLVPGDVLVINDSKVIKARLNATKDTGGKVSILVERVTSEHEALCQVRSSKPLKPERTLTCEDQTIHIVGREGEFYRLRFDYPVITFLSQHGEVPLPHYIERGKPSDRLDEQRYQTVYASKQGAVAAPTAGLHFDDAFLKQIAAKGIDICRVTLHVGAGTFQPVRVSNIADHVMHYERYEIPETTLNRLIARSSRVVAVGTTVVRTLESWAQTKQSAGETNLFITPGFKFQVVDALVTNFHLPESTLLMLVSAFKGRERMLAAYEEAVREEYRFFSYGDAMFMDRATDA